jgi:hypothetical protein
MMSTLGDLLALVAYAAAIVLVGLWLLERLMR